MVGTPYTITYSIDQVTPVIPNLVWNVSGGTVIVMSTSTGATLFQSFLGTGSAEDVFGLFLTMSLEPSATIKSGLFEFIGSSIGLGTSADVTATLVPEPNALEGLLFGTGVLGLAEMTRRKLRLGT